MPKPSKKKNRPKNPEPAPDVLKGWQQITAFLGQSVSVAQRWAKDGMPDVLNTSAGLSATVSPTTGDFLPSLQKKLLRMADGLPIFGVIEQRGVVWIYRRDFVQLLMEFVVVSAALITRSAKTER